MSTVIDSMLERARAATRALSTATTAQRDEALARMADAIDRGAEAILAANAGDLSRARESGLSGAMLDRLALDPSRVRAIAESARTVRALADPLAESRELGVRPNGLRVCKRRAPLGVIAVVYEARPNVTVECAALTVKSGNALVLRGGREALGSNAALAERVRAGLAEAGLSPDAVQLVPDAGREHVAALLGATGRVDLCIPRGGAGLMAMVDEHAKVPVIRHGQGICQVFLDATAEPVMAARIAVNAKAQRPGVCNAAETLLVHRALLGAGGAFEGVARALRDAGVALRADALCGADLSRAGIAWAAATESDWDAEFLALVLAVRAVSSLEEAMEHIAVHGSGHTAAIVTEDAGAAERFLAGVEASCVLHNASTRFNDGGELGLGAEIGISTSRMHAWGPMGLRELTAEKFVVYGTGQIRG